MNWRDRIVCNPEIFVGKPTIKGTRISVELILDCWAAGWPNKDLHDSHPHITDEDLLAVFAFVAKVMRDRRTWALVNGKA